MALGNRLPPEFYRSVPTPRCCLGPDAGAGGGGGFMMNSQEMETAVRLKLDLVVLVLDDGAYGMIRWKQSVDNFADFGMTFGNPDFVRYAEAYGARGHRVEATEDLVPTLEAAGPSQSRAALGAQGCLASV
jgi:thiamine pyrophosphate-dependent acetolactate synthase large subunit-like protein